MLRVVAEADGDRLALAFVFDLEVLARLEA
jgi:hypothetical protein